MRVHWLQHAEFEDLGCIAPWLVAHGHALAGTRLFAGAPPPGTGTFDALIVMGGPMNIHQHAAHPWLVAEKTLIRAALDAGKRVLGICLGAQLIADALGGRVSANAEPEIGWFPVTLTEAGRAHRLLADLPAGFTAFHWHGDTWTLPRGSHCLASSAACAQQAFAFDDGRVLGLQFHLEVTRANAEEWFRHERVIPSKFVQPAEHILAQRTAFDANNRAMESILGQFFAD